MKYKPIYPNFEKEVRAKKLTWEEIAHTIGKHPNTLRNKRTFGCLSVEDAIIIKNEYFPEHSISYLFGEGGENR